MDSSLVSVLAEGRVEPRIYAFSTNTVPNYLKVGDTYRPVSVRLDEWRERYPDLTQEFEDSALVAPDRFFRDYSVHAFLETDRHRPRISPSGFPAGAHQSREFFRDAVPADVADAIADIRADFAAPSGRYQFYDAASALPAHVTLPSIGLLKPRPNQQEAIDRFKVALEKGRKNLLMYAVMRFGKSFTAMCCAKEMEARLVVVVSAKADVRDEWRKAVEQPDNFRGDFSFFSSEDLARNPRCVSDAIDDKGRRAVVFLTLQDLQGADVKSKHRALLRRRVDLLIVDETHFGARAESFGAILRATAALPKSALSKAERSGDAADPAEADAVAKAFRARVTLHLSGTPYRILMGSEFAKDDIISFCQFTDIARAKEQWDRENVLLDEKDGKPLNEWDNPYYGFPQMLRFALRPSAQARKRLEALRKDGETYAFSALFRTASLAADATGAHRRFLFENEILEILDVIDGTRQDDELFSFLDDPTLKRGMMCRHLVCVLPYCASCDALAALLDANRARFRNLGAYRVLNISGHDCPKDLSTTEGVCSAVRASEAAGEKTITLTVNRMLTGSTVPEWDTMLYFKDTSSPQEYDQAVFRLQNQYVVEMHSQNGDVVRYDKKPQTILVDFDPTRLFTLQERKSKIYNVNDDRAGNARLRERIAEEIRYSPIVAVNADRLVRVEAADVMDAVSRYSAARGVSDAAKSLGVDLVALEKSPSLLDAIDRENPLGSRNGLVIAANSGSGDGGDGGDIETPGAVTAHEGEGGSSGDAAPATPDKEAARRRELEAKIRSYYSRILFFAFLTKDAVSSVDDVIAALSRGRDNARIASNVRIDRNVLKAIRKYFNPFVLSDLDYEIANLSRLSRDASLSPLERARRMIAKFDRFGPSEIVTPAPVAAKMVSLLPDAEFLALLRGRGLFLDISSKSGEFALALCERAKALAPDMDMSCRILAIPSSRHAYEFTRKTFEALGLDAGCIASFTSNDVLAVLGRSPSPADYARVAAVLSQRKPFWKIAMNDIPARSSRKTPIAMIVGNPPYQEQGASGGTNDAPIFQNSATLAATASRYSSLVIQSKWFAGGRENLLGPFRADMLTCGHVRILETFADAHEVFPNAVEIKGGVCYYLRDENYNGPCNYTLHQDAETINVPARNLAESDILVRDPRLARIVEKVLATAAANKSRFVSDVLSGDTPFGIPTNPADSKKTPIPTSDTPGNGFDVRLDLRGEKNRRIIAYVRRADVTRNASDINADKVFIAKAGGSGDDQMVLSEPIVAPKGSVCSQTFIYAKFGTAEEAEAFAKYLRTRFLRILVSARKITQDALSKVYSYVPLQDFTSSSDIDWSRPIPEIDAALYAKYGLTPAEIAFIESKVKPMS